MRKLLLFLVSIGLLHGACADPPYANGYTFCRELIVNYTVDKVPNTDQTDFPVVFCLGATISANCNTGNFLATQANGGKLTDANGFDLIFTSDNTGSTPLSYERAIQDLTNGASEFWVKIPTLSHTANTKMYLFYQNASVTTDQSNPTAVWTNGFAAVHHLSILSGTITSIPDSTGVNGFGSFSSGGIDVLGISGQMGAGASFQSSKFAFITATGFSTGSTERTVEAWVNIISASSAMSILGYGTNASDGNRWSIYWDGSAWNVEGRNCGATFGGTRDSSWHYIAITLPPGQTTFGGGKYYIDGVLATISSSSCSVLTPVTSTYEVANIPGITSGSGNFTGYFDEGRVSIVARSADWFVTNYNQMTNNIGFISMSTVESGTGSGPRILIFR